MAVAEIFLSAFITVLFEKLASPDFWKSIRGEGIASQLKKSIRLLSLLRAVLVDAGQKQITDEAVRDWVNDLQTLTYDLDDIVDELLYEVTRRELGAELRSSTSPSSCISMSMVTSLIPICFIIFSHRMKTKLDEITERLKDLTERKHVLGLRDNIPDSSNITTERPPMAILVDASSVQGRDSDKEVVLRLVLDDKTCGDDVSVGIIPIVGMGGVGKTTLAQLVYNDEKVKAWFDVRVWVCVSDDFDIFMITKIIFQSVTGERSNFEALNQLQMALKERISKMKFLIVLDDVWNQNHEKWELLQCSFQVGLPGSKIVVTTRNDGVVSTMHCGSSYRLKELTEDASVSLFAQKSLGAQNFEAHPNFRVIGELIVRKCGGLPLALKTLGSLLSTESVEKWDELLNSDIWNLSEDESGILPALRLSYHHLSPDLKQLFAYCSLFPKDYSFVMDELVLLWMGEGFLQKSDSHQRMEDLGQKYFKELLSRSFFQHSSDGGSRYVMHDLMNDLAQFVAREFFFRSDDEKKNRTEHQIKERTHHASFIRHEYEVFNNFKDFHRAKGLRTFLPLPVRKSEGWPFHFYISSRVLVDLVPKLQCLRVLSLSGYFIRELPDSISRMRHLRYLNLSQTEIECLPQWVGHLYNLQTLLLFGCHKLARLPTTFMHLTGLRHFNFADTPKLKEMPLGIGTLTSLQTLSKMLLTEGSGSRLKELKDLSDLRGELSIIGLHNVMNVHDAKAAKLISKQGLDDLEMEWSDNFDGSRDEALEKEVLDALKPHTNLRRVKIKCYGGVEFPSWIGTPSFCHIGEVTLAGCRKCTLMPSLGQLPHLKKLFIGESEGVKVVGPEFYNAGNGRVPVAFPSLEILQFEDMRNWEEWSSENVDDDVSVFPCLRELEMRGCPKLEKVSPGKLPSLQLLNMRGCGEVALRSMLELALEITTLKVDNIVGLTGLHEGVLVGVKIVDLEIWGCKELKYLWRRGSEAYANLKRLRVTQCEQLVSLVEGEGEGEGEEEGVLPRNLEELTLERCANLEKLPHNWWNNLKCLKSLTISGCLKLQYSWGKQDLVKRNGGGFKINQSSSSSSSSIMEEDEEEIFCQLERMDILGCSSLRWLPTGGQKKQLPTTLKHLRIWGCEQLEEPEEKNWLLNSKSSLESIDIDNWVNLKSFTSSSTPPTRELGGTRGGGGLIGFQNFIHLTSLTIENCPGLESFPERGGGGGLPPCLRILVISGCWNLKWLLPNANSNSNNYGGWDQCDSLTHLTISDCPRLVEGFPCGVWPPNLQSLGLGGELGGEGKPNNNGITQGEWGLHNAPPTLVNLALRGSKFSEVVSFSINSTTRATSTGDQSHFLLPPSITTLRLSNMEKLETLSTGLQNLTSLQHLTIWNCPKLRSLPETLLPSLHSLDIWLCSSVLKRRCSKKEKGDYWPLLTSHIPRVEIDYDQ